MAARKRDTDAIGSANCGLRVVLVVGVLLWLPRGSAGLEFGREKYSSSESAAACNDNIRAPIHLPNSCFSSDEVTAFRDELLETLEDKPDVHLLFFYLNINVNGDVFYPGLCCWNHDQSADGNTPLAWAWWRDLSGKAYLDMSLQHVDMWMLPLVTMQRNVHVVSDLTLTVNATCWWKRQRSQRTRDLANVLQILIHVIDGDKEDDGLCWREQIAPFHPLSTLLWDPLSPWGVDVVQYHVVSQSGKDVLLEPLWTIRWLTLMLRCMLYLLALYMPLPILAAWQSLHDHALSDHTNVCLKQQRRNQQQTTEESIIGFALGVQRADNTPLDLATQAKLRCLLNPHILLPSCSLISPKRAQSTRLWFCLGFASILLWQFICVWWTSLPGSVDVCERCLPAAKHKLLIALLLVIGTYVWVHMPAPSLTVRHAPLINFGKKRLPNGIERPGGNGRKPHRYRITLRTLSLTAMPLDSIMDCDADLGRDGHGTHSFIGALYDALLLSLGVLTVPKQPATPDQTHVQWTWFKSILRLPLTPCLVCARAALRLLTIVRVSPLFLIVSMLLQRNQYLSFARHHHQRGGAQQQWVYKSINVCVFAFTWCFVVWLLHDLFHVLAYAFVGMVINAKLFVPWLVLLLSLVYQVRVAYCDLNQPFVAAKATVLEEYVKDTLMEDLCSRTVEHTFTVLVLRLVSMMAGAFEGCYWEARALHSARFYTEDLQQQLNVVYWARFVKVLGKWLLFACVVQLLLLLLSSVYGFETLPAYMQLLAGVAPLGLTWMVSQTNHNPQLMIRLQQASHVRSVMKDLCKYTVCSCTTGARSATNFAPRTTTSSDSDLKEE